jgi:5-methylcytosine-specific restriction protein A
MPTSAPKPCAVCKVLVRDGGTRCEAHRYVHTGRFADKARGSRHARGYGTAWDKLRDQVLRRDGGICQVCMADGLVHVGTHVDHIVAKKEGGTDDLANLRTICEARHRAKTQGEARRGRGGSDL